MSNIVSTNIKPTDFIFSKELDPLNPKKNQKSDSKEKNKKNLYWFKNSQTNFLVKKYGDDYVNLGKRRLGLEEIDEEALKNKLKEPADISRFQKKAKDKLQNFKVVEDKFTTYKKHLLNIDAFHKAMEGDKKVEEEKKAKKIDLPTFSLKGSKVKKAGNVKQSNFMKNSRAAGLRKF